MRIVPGWPCRLEQPCQAQRLQPLGGQSRRTMLLCGHRPPLQAAGKRLKHIRRSMACPMRICVPSRKQLRPCTAYGTFPYHGTDFLLRYIDQHATDVDGARLYKYVDAYRTAATQLHSGYDRTAAQLPGSPSIATTNVCACLAPQGCRRYQQ